MLCAKREIFIDDISGDTIKYYDTHTLIYDDSVGYHLDIVYNPKLEYINIYTYSDFTREIVFDFDMLYHYLCFTEESLKQAILFLIQQNADKDWISKHYDYNFLDEMSQYILDNLYFDTDAIYGFCYGV